MNLVVSIGEGNNNSSFDIFFRKNSNGYLALRFLKEENEVRLISKNGSSIKILKKNSLPYSFFGKTMMLNLTVKGGSVNCKLSRGNILEYENKNLPVSEGRIGFTASQLRLVLHQMNVTSVRRDISTGKKKRRK